MLSCPGGVKVLLHSSSSLVLEEVEKKESTMRVVYGEIEAWVKKSSGSLEVITPISEAEVHGANFRVLVDRSGASVWDVFDGKVKVESQTGQRVKLSGGDHVNIDSSGLLSPQEHIAYGLIPSPQP